MPENGSLNGRNGEMEPTGGLTVAVLAKATVVGHVKTRLLPELTADQAAAVHEAMLRCVLARLPEAMGGKDRQAGVRFVLALDAPGGGLPWAAPEPWRTVEQGTGDLGDRLGRLWRQLGGGPIAFFGADSPDVPRQVLHEMPARLRQMPVLLGATHDGGYWTLAAQAYEPQLLDGIDWGGPNVYHQTLARALAAGLPVAELEPWYDVDRPADVKALCSRLARSDEPALVRLRQRLDQIVG